jgi:hypothetical protein
MSTKPSACSKLRSSVCVAVTINSWTSSRFKHSRSRGQWNGHNIEFLAVWDDPRSQTNIRVMASVDDDRWPHFFKPLTTDFIMTPNGSPWRMTTHDVASGGKRHYQPARPRFRYEATLGSANAASLIGFSSRQSPMPMSTR